MAKPTLIPLLLREQSTGNLYIVKSTRENDEVYRTFGRDVNGMVGTDDPGFDVSNVQIDVLELPKAGVRPVLLEFPEDTAI